MCMQQEITQRGNASLLPGSTSWDYAISMNENNTEVLPLEAQVEAYYPIFQAHYTQNATTLIQSKKKTPNTSRDTVLW